MERRSKVDYDSVKYKEYLWDLEYGTRKAVPSTNTFNPSSSLRKFISNYPNILKESALDLGSGNGRNSIFLASNGFKNIIGLELSTVGFNIASSELKKHPEFKKNIKYYQGDAVSNFKKLDQKFDLIIDMCFIHLLTKEQREELIDGIKKKLNTNGYYLIFTLMANSPAVIDLKKKFPGLEENSYRFYYENDVISEKAFTKEELIKSFKPLKLIEYEEYQTVTAAFKGEFPRIYTTALFQKVN